MDGGHLCHRFFLKALTIWLFDSNLSLWTPYRGLRGKYPPSLSQFCVAAICPRGGGGLDFFSSFLIESNAWSHWVLRVFPVGYAPRAPLCLRFLEGCFHGLFCALF